MADVSVVEFIVYALICYTGVIGLIASAFRDTPITKSQSMTRSIWLIPSIFCAFMLASIGGFDVILDSGTTTNTIINLNTTEVFTEIFEADKRVTIVATTWTSLHILFFVILTLYVIINMLMLFGKRD